MGNLNDLNTFLSACGQLEITGAQASKVSTWLEGKKGLDNPDIDDVAAWFRETLEQEVRSYLRQISAVDF